MRYRLLKQVAILPLANKLHTRRVDYIGYYLELSLCCLKLDIVKNNAYMCQTREMIQLSVNEQHIGVFVWQPVAFSTRTNYVTTAAVLRISKLNQ